MKKRKIKICHIVSRVTGRADGLFKHLIAQFTLLDKEFFEHYLISPYSKEIDFETTKLGIKTFFVSEIDTNKYFTIFNKIRRVLKENDFDILCCHTLKPVVIGGYLNLFNKKRIVFFTHGIFLNNDYNTTFEKIVYWFLLKILFIIKRVNVLCPSEWNKNKLENELGKNLNINVYYDGEAVLSMKNDRAEERRTINIPVSKFKILFVGRLAREKDPFLAIKIFQHLENDNVSLDFFGEGELENELKDYVHKQKLKNVHFNGFVKDIFRFYQNFDLLLITSKREGMPIVLWEATHSGLPFLSKNVGGAAEIIRYGRCGYIFNHESEAVEIIKSLMNNPLLLKAVGQTGKYVIKQHFSKQNFIQYFSDFYQKL